MQHTSDSERSVNLLGALALALADRMRGATDAAAGAGASAPAALVAIAGFLDGQPIEALGRVLGLSHSGTVRLVDRLADAGLVTRRPGPDGRTLALAATAAGRRAAQRTLDARAGILHPALDALPAGERETLTRALEHLLAALTVQPGADPGRICRLCDADACGHHEGRCPVTEAAAAARAGA